MKVKVCGITRMEDAQTAADLGAWALGFVFYQKSRRSVHPSYAARLISQLPDSVFKVGVFVDPTAEEVRQTQKETGIQILQFHGEETPEFCGQFGIPYFKSFHLEKPQDLSKPKLYSDAMAVLVDSQTRTLKGGTGVCADWALAAQIQKPPMLILAGGLNSQNIHEAIRLTAPDAVDISSGLEDSPGIKNQKKMKDFFKKVRL